MLLALCIGALAAGTSGKCGPSAYWSFDSSTGTLTISRQRRDERLCIPVGDPDPRPWSAYLSEIKNRCDRGFDYENRERVIFQLILHYSQDWKNVQVIGENAFMNCTSLTGDLVIPDSVTTIDRWAFFSAA